VLLPSAVNAPVVLESLPPVVVVPVPSAVLVVVVPSLPVVVVSPALVSVAVALAVPVEESSADIDPFVVVTVVAPPPVLSLLASPDPSPVESPPHAATTKVAAIRSTVFRMVCTLSDSSRAEITSA